MNQVQAQEIEVAYHEAAHVVAAYIAGYSCHRLELLEQGHGETHMDYGNDTLLVVALINRDRWRELYDKLPSPIKVGAKPVAKTVCYIYVAGVIAETIRKHGRNYIGKVEVELSGPDSKHTDSLCTFFNMNISEIITEMYRMLELDPIWNAVEAIASALMEKKVNRSINKAEIESLLSESGFFEYIKGSDNST